MENNIWIDKMRDLNPDALWPTGFAAAITGIINDASGPPRFIIDEDKVVRILVDDHDMTTEEAWEYYGFNIEGAYMGENQPLYKGVSWDE